jgi:hypothetical protein
MSPILLKLSFSCSHFVCSFAAATFMIRFIKLILLNLENAFLLVILDKK